MMLEGNSQGRYVVNRIQRAVAAAAGLLWASSRR
jgi:hypothetical protein